MRAADDDEPDVVPDAGLNDPRDPVPRVVIASLPLGYDRRHAALPQPPRRQIEDNVNHVPLPLEHLGEVEAIRRVRAAKPANLLVVHHHPTGIVQPKTLQVNVGARLHPSVRNRGVADPMAVLDPFRFPRFEGLVPVGDDAGGQQGGLHRAGHLHRHRWHVGLMHFPCPFVPPRQFPEDAGTKPATVHFSCERSSTCRVAASPFTAGAGPSRTGITFALGSRSGECGKSAPRAAAEYATKAHANTTPNR